MKLCPLYAELKRDPVELDDGSMIPLERVITILLEYANSNNLVYVLYIMVGGIAHHRFTLQRSG